MDKSRYHRLFLDESRECLSAYHHALSHIEQASSSSAPGTLPPPGDPAHLETLFRAAHSVKGMAASLACASLATLAHLLEDVADTGRPGGALSPTALELLWRGGAAMEALLAQEARAGLTPGDAAGEPGPAEERALEDLLADLRRFHRQMPAGPPDPRSAPPSDPSSSTPLPSEASSGPPAGGACLRVRLDPASAMRQTRAWMVARELCRDPAVHGVEPPLAQLKQAWPEDGHLMFPVALDPASPRGEALLQGALQLQGVLEVHWRSPVDEPPATAPLTARPRGPTPAGEGEADDDAGQRTVRVRAQALDRLVDSVAELLQTRARLQGLAQASGQAELIEALDDLERSLRELYAQVVDTRMTPLGVLTERFPKWVRDLARTHDKSVQWRAEDVDIEVDRAVLDGVYTPLLHMVRNAIDHAHEGDEARLRAGKPAAMRLTLRAARERDRFVLSLADDGAGIDVDALRAKAHALSLLSAETTADWSEERWLELVFWPGLSVRDEVTATSGRGVGLDAVRDQIRRLGGEVRIATHKGQGTTFYLDLPQRLALLRVFVVAVGDDERASLFALPVSRVQGALDLQEHDARGAGRGSALSVDGVEVPLFDLGERLGYPTAGPRSTTAVLVEHGDARAALCVRRIVGQEEVVVMPLGPPLSQVAFLAGAAHLADGSVTFVLEPQRLLEERLPSPSPRPVERPGR